MSCAEAVSKTQLVSFHVTWPEVVCAVGMVY